MNWLIALLAGGGLWLYSKNKAATKAATAANPGLNASALNILQKGESTTAADIAALSGGVSAISSTGTTLKNLFSSSPSAMKASSTADNSSAAENDDGTPGGDDFGTLTDNSVQQPAVSGTDYNENYDFAGTPDANGDYTEGDNSGDGGGD